MQANNRQLAEKPRMQKLYEATAVPALERDLKTTNRFAVPRLVKVVLNVGAGRASKDQKILDAAVATLTTITGQKPVVTKAKKSISNFKIRKGMGIGATVTLRGHRMYEFLDKLVNVSLPRVRDFQGLPTKSFDTQGNYTLAFREHNVFPEISSDTLDSLHGLEITVCTTAQSKNEAQALLKQLGFPFQA